MRYPAVPEGKHADVGKGVRMHYHDAGSGELGAIVFAHGSGPGASGWSNFKGNYPSFAEQGFRTIVPDTVGYGYSTKPVRGEYSLDDVAAQYRALLEALGVSRATVVGNSQGGAISIRLALNYPDLVERLVLMAPGGLETRETYMAMEGIRTMLRVIFKEGVTRQTLREVFKLQLHDESLITDEIIEERFQIAETQPQDTISRIRVDNQESVLSQIHCPVLCFWGVQDKFCPVDGASKIASGCRNARTILISECGHWVMLEYRKLFNELTLKFAKGEMG